MMIGVLPLVWQDMNGGGNPDTMANVDTKSYAVFGEINRSLSDTLSMLAGFRYTDEEKKVQLTTQGLSGLQIVLPVKTSPVNWG